MSTVLVKKIPGSAKPRILILPDNNNAPMPKFVGLEFDQTDPEVPVLQADTTGSTGAYIRLAYEYEGNTYAYDEWQENDGEKVLTVSLASLVVGAVALLVQVSNDQSDVYSHRAAIVNTAINLPYDSDAPFDFPIALAVASVGCATNEWGIAGAVFGSQNLNTATGLLSFANSAEAQGGGMMWRKCVESGNISQVILLSTNASNAKITNVSFENQLVQGTSDNWLNFESRIQYAPDNNFVWVESNEGWQPNDSNIEASFDSEVVVLENGGYLRMQVRQTLTGSQYLCGEDIKLIPDPQVVASDAGGYWRFVFSLVAISDSNPSFQEAQILPSITIVGGTYAGDYTLPLIAAQSGEPQINSLPAGLQDYVYSNPLEIYFSKDLFTVESVTEIIVKAGATFIYEGASIQISSAQNPQASAPIT